MNDDTGGSTSVNEVTEGSAVVDFTIYFDSTKPSADIDAVVTKISSDTGLASILANSTTMTNATPIVTPGFAPVRSQKRAKTKLLALEGETSTTGTSTLSVRSVGLFNSWAYKIGDGEWVPVPPETISFNSYFFVKSWIPISFALTLSSSF